MVGDSDMVPAGGVTNWSAMEMEQLRLALESSAVGKRVWAYMTPDGQFVRVDQTEQAQERHDETTQAKGDQPVIAEPPEQVLSDERLWITRKEAASMLHVGLSTLDFLSHEPGFPVALRKHRIVRFDRAEFVKWAREYGKHLQAPVPEPAPPEPPSRRSRRKSDG